MKQLLVRVIVKDKDGETRELHDYVRLEELRLKQPICVSIEETGYDPDFVKIISLGYELFETSDEK